MASATWSGNSPFHLVPCSPYVGTTIASRSPTPRTVPDIGEAAEIFVADSPRSIAGRDVPQTPVFQHVHESSGMQNQTPHNVHRAATPEQEVPKTPIKTESSSKKPSSLLTVKLKSDLKTTSPRQHDTKELNLFHGDDIFG